jgi:hypothetical protein
VTGAVDQAEPEDRVELAEEAICEPSTEEREEVHAHHEDVEDLLRRTLTCRRRQVDHHHRRGQELLQDVSHPVEAEALAAFVRDDERDLGRHLRAVSVSLAHEDAVARASCRLPTLA